MIRIWNNKGKELTSQNEVRLAIQPRNKKQAWKWIQRWVKRSKKDKSLSPQKLLDYTVIED